MRCRVLSFYLSELLSGGFLYCLIEILFRGYTHPSMFLLGGVCLVSIGIIRRVLAGQPLAKKLLCACGAITALEFLCGLVVNIWLGLSVWDYSSMPYNLLGQVCLSYSAAWCLLALPAMGLDYLYFSECGQKTKETPAGGTYCVEFHAKNSGKLPKSLFKRGKMCYNNGSIKPEVHNNERILYH